MVVQSNSKQGSLATRIERYLETLTIQQGAGAGEPFRVLPWERRFLRGAFADGVAESALSVARGNGKSHLLSGIACAYVDPDGPLHSRLANVTICAASFEQARVIFEASMAFLQDKYGDALADKNEWRTWDTAQQAMLRHVPSGARLRCIGSDPRRAHGLTGSFFCDEPAQWPPATGEAMRAALLTALGKQAGGRLIALGTRPADESHWFAKMLDDGADYAQVHAAKADDSPFTLATIRKSNPSLSHMPELRRSILREAGRARLDPALLQAYKALRLNQGTSDVVEALLLDADTWARIEGHTSATGQFVLGIDLGGSMAMSCGAAYFPDTGHLDCVAVMASTPNLAERGLRDGVGGAYQLMHERGELVLGGEYVADVSVLLDEVRSRWGRPVAIVADRYREAELRQALEAANFPSGSALIFRGQGYRDGGEDVRGFRAAVLDGRVTAKPSHLMRVAMASARVITDASANQKMAKMTEGGRRLRARDDAASAAIIAVATGDRNREIAPVQERRFYIVS